MYYFRHLWKFIFLLLTHIKLSISDPRATRAEIIFRNITREAETDLAVYYVDVLTSITTQFESQRYYGQATSGTGNNTVYAFAECMRDLSEDDCNLCFSEVLSSVQFLTGGGRLFYDGCFLRYDDYMFFDEVLSPLDRVVCGEEDFVGDNIIKGVFGDAVSELVRRMSLDGPRNDGFFTGIVRRGGNTNLAVYGLAQCWEYVNRSGCAECLENSVSRIGACAPKTEGRALNAGCYVRYSTTRFYNNSGNEGGSNHRIVILASTFGAAFVVVALISFFATKIILRQRRAKKKLSAMFVIVNNSKINYSYETLERATNYFNESNKLGQGGSGSVYKGILPSGQIVAVKMLMFKTTQWVDHFFNEVDLISGINHKNLVKLLGCSITGPESLLVYEYVPNLSLHDHLIGRKGDRRQLGWEERYKIIMGVAEGLAFLHEESNPRIIHRDINLSNVLLDDDFTAKIADFGLVRLFPEGKSHITTGIAGTLGYVAPEYIVRGKLTEKVDVYSFGILVIEVVCGTTVNAFAQDSKSILRMVWNLYGTQRLSEAVDSSIKGNKFSGEEANKLLRIGLACVQADAERRPTMSVVVKMIRGEHEIISNPTQPPFLSSSSSAYDYYYRPNTEGGSGSSGNKITEIFLDSVRLSPYNHPIDSWSSKQNT